MGMASGSSGKANSPDLPAGRSGELALPELPDAIPMGRRGVPQDMAGAVGFLVGPFGRYTSGQAFHPNGGIHR